MKVAIIEADHFQYGLTQSQIFEESEKIFFVTQAIKDNMYQYYPELCKGEFYIIESISIDAKKIIEICNNKKIDLFLLSPVFSDFESVLEISKKIKCKKVISIHNLNFWLKSKFRTPKSYKERILKQKIVQNFDYVAVEDFIYAHLKNNEPSLFKKYKFIYIPFTIFHERKNKKYKKEDDTFKVVLPGSIHKDRRRYEETIKVINYFAKKNANITFSFAGKALENYGMWVVSQLEEANKIKPGIATYFDINKEIVPDMFLKEMETSDLVLSTSTLEFKALGTTEYIGKTKPTAAIHDMMSFQLPGLLPSHLSIPKNLEGSVFNYNGAEELKNILNNLLDNPKKQEEWHKQAVINSYKFTASETRKNLPFFYNQCKNCVMDNTNDPDIWFDEKGNCNYCNEYYEYTKSITTDETLKLEKIAPLIKQIKIEGKNKKYDCIVGISGGTDSAFLVCKLIEMGLRPLAVHYDNSWNSETATQNIEMLLKKLNVDLYTHVNDWEEFKDLQLSFFEAGVIDIELISDQAIIALLYNIAEKYNTKYIFSGHNTATEFILPTSWYHWKLDALNVKSIQNKFGKKTISTYPILTYLKQYKHSKFTKTRIIHLLNYINYDKSATQKILTEKYAWKDYGAKHNESIFTRFYQNYILPVKFNVDKRKAHLSSLICSGQITKEAALAELNVKIWESEQTLLDKEYVLKKLGVSERIFDNWMKEKPKSHFDYPSYITRHDKIVRKIKKMIGKK
jgi:N-acetyl sugar amidotransferase